MSDRPTSEGAAVCPECGAPESDALTCQNRYDECLIREFSDPEYGAVHHHTVPAFMLQHPSRLSREGWVAMRQTLSDFLIAGVTPAQMRARHKHKPHGGASLAKGERLALPAGFRWAQTILTVDLTAPDRYRRTIEQWARAVLADALSLHVEEKESNAPSDPER